MDDTADMEAGNTAETENANGASTDSAMNATKDSGAQTETNTSGKDTERGASQDSQNSDFDFEKIKFPEGVSVSDEDKTKFNNTLARIGIKDNNSAQAFADWLFETVAEASKESEAKRKSDAEASKKEWDDIKSGWKSSLEGDADFGKDYELNIKRANDAITKFGGTELIEWLDASDLRGQPALVKTFARIGKEIEDARLLKGGSGVDVPKIKRDRYNQPMLEYKD